MKHLYDIDFGVGAYDETAPDGCDYLMIQVLKGVGPKDAHTHYFNRENYSLVGDIFVSTTERDYLDECGDVLDGRDDGENFPRLAEEALDKAEEIGLDRESLKKAIETYCRETDCRYRAQVEI